MPSDDTTIETPYYDEYAGLTLPTTLKEYRNKLDSARNEGAKIGLWRAEMQAKLFQKPATEEPKSNPPEEERVPKGWRVADAYESPMEIIVMGDPPEEIMGEPVDHDCDEMGCGFEHVTYRLNKYPDREHLTPGQTARLFTDLIDYGYIEKGCELAGTEIRGSYVVFFGSTGDENLYPLTDDSHNCDEMGCSSIGDHILFRLEK